MKHLYSIMNLDTAHIDEICEDIKYQVKNGVANCALFKMTLVPEGTPPADKAAVYCEQYKKFKEKLDADNIPNGVLVQATMGHGWVLGAKFPYQHLVGLSGQDTPNSVCPYDEGFREYLYSAFRTIALCKPGHIMVDDDFRLLGRPEGGCACPLHLKRFAELSGEAVDKKELLDIINAGGEKGKKYKEIFVETQRESLVDAAKVMRKAIDSVDETLPGSFCCVGTNAEFAAEISEILAGKGNPKIVRLNNGNYTPAGARFFSNHFFRAAAQIEKLKGEVDFTLAETDTCPQNRYSTGAMSLHTHFVGTLLEGACGAKQWITRLSSYEPESGKAYRKVLSKYAGFYEEIAKLTPSLSWLGCRINVHKEPDYRPGVPNYYGEMYNGWGKCVLEKMGFPMYFSSENGGVLCLDGAICLDDDKILEALHGCVLLDSGCAKELIDRGFGGYLGIDVREWTGKNIKGEKLLVNGNSVSSQQRAKELVITDASAKALSYMYNTLDGENIELLFPGSVLYKNSLGGTVVTFCGAPSVNYTIVEAFSFLCYSRKLQLTEILKNMGALPVYYPEDEEVYLKAANMEVGGLFCALFNIGLDPIDNVELCFERAVTRIERLMPDGSRKAVEFEVRDGRYITNEPAYTLNPLVLFAY